MIYFIKHTDYVKIGFTNKLDNRLPQLQTSCPVKLEVLSIIRGGRDKEQELHSAFSHVCTSGEWFKYCDEIQGYIDDNYDTELMWELGFASEEKHIGSKFKQARISKNLTLEDVAEKVGITKQSLTETESREVYGGVTIRKLQILAKAIGCEFHYRIK